MSIVVKKKGAIDLLKASTERRTSGEIGNDAVLNSQLFPCFGAWPRSDGTATSLDVSLLKPKAFVARRISMRVVALLDRADIGLYTEIHLGAPIINPDTFMAPFSAWTGHRTEMTAHESVRCELARSFSLQLMD